MCSRDLAMLLLDFLEAVVLLVLVWLAVVRVVVVVVVVWLVRLNVPDVLRVRLQLPCLRCCL